MEVLRLYKSLLRESQKFTSYNYRHYFILRIKDGFKANKGLSSPEAIAQEIKNAYSSLNTIRRQVIVGQLYQTHKLVIENDPGAGSVAGKN